MRIRTCILAGRHDIQRAAKPIISNLHSLSSCLLSRICHPIQTNGSARSSFYLPNFLAINLGNNISYYTKENQHASINPDKISKHKTI